MRVFIKIIQKAVEKIPRRPYENLQARCFKKAKNPEWNDFEYRFLGKKPSPNFELPKQELYVRVEAPKNTESKRCFKGTKLRRVWCLFIP
jgi:NAD(P)H-quinone oxidoreductase subunit H